MSAKISPKGLRWLVWSTFFVLIPTIGLAWFFYPEKYEFFQEAISSLGGLRSNKENLPNFPSYVIFSAGFIIMGILTVSLSLIYLVNLKRFKYGILKGILLLIMGVGAIFTAIPWDFNFLHGIGAFMYIAGLAIINFVFQLLRYVKRHVPKPTDAKRAWDYYWDLSFVILLFAAGAFYFVIQISSMIGYSLPFISPALAQKIVLFAGCIAIFLLDIDDVK